MRLTALDVTGFRAFSGHQTFDLDADAVIVVGANGQGKTSLFDAALWALTGRIVRLGPEGSVISMFSSAGEARVALSLRDADGAMCRAVRSTDGSSKRFSLEIDGETVRESVATATLLERLWPQARAAAKPEDALLSALERGVYLQQDLVRSFIDAATDKERFATIGELVGAGRINELQMALERSRLAWSKATNLRADEAKSLESRAAGLRDHLDRLGGGDARPPVDSEAWAKWWKDAQEAGISVRPPKTSQDVDAGELLDAAVKELQARSQETSRSRQDAASLFARVSALPPKPQDDLAALEAVVVEARAAAESARSELASAEQHAAALRRARVETQEAREELRALAEIALRHLGEHCPVCDQEYDHDATVRRLEARVKGEATSEDLERLPDVSLVAVRVEEREREAVEAARAVSEAAQRIREWEALERDLAEQVGGLGMEGTSPDDWRRRPQARMVEFDERIKAFAELRQAGEQLALALARAGELSRRAELEHELDALKREVEGVQTEVQSRQQTGELVNTIIDGLREASSDVIEVQLRRLEPLLQRIYATADPHPAFRAARLIGRMRGGHGRVVPRIEDLTANVDSEAPETVLSSSQMNVLAVSVFLAFNLGMPALPLNTVILDDPLQSLDDLNLLGLIDLLRRTRDERQLVISTHDRRFASLLERKLRPVEDGQRTVVVDLQGWDREGPHVTQRDVDRDPTPVRIAA